MPLTVTDPGIGWSRPGPAAWPWSCGRRGRSPHPGHAPADSAGSSALSYCYGLELHHIREDGAFSAFEQQFPGLIPVISRLRSEHRTMAQALAGLQALLTAGPGDPGEILAALDKAVTGLEEHFAYEEEHLIAPLRQTHP